MDDLSLEEDKKEQFLFHLGRELVLVSLSDKNIPHHLLLSEVFQQKNEEELSEQFEEILLEPV